MHWQPNQIVKEHRAQGETRTHVAALRVRYPGRWTTRACYKSTFAVGPEGLEPSPTWLRARHAAANTLIPSFRDQMKLGPDGLEPSPCRLKVCCAAVTPRPRARAWVRLSRVCICRITTISFAESFKGPEKSLGVELNHRFRLIRATCFRYTTERSCHSRFNQSGWSESNRLSRVPKTRGRPVPFIPSFVLHSIRVARMGVEPISPP